MTELKTLKDIDRTFVTDEMYSDIKGGRFICSFIPENRLKSEAVKWFKFFSNAYSNPNFKELAKKMKLTKTKNKAISSWIINFFNITEADLQEKK